MHRFMLAEFRSERHSPPGDPGRTPNTTTRRTMTAHDREQRIDRNLQQRVHNELMAFYTDETRKGARLLLIGILLLLVAVSIPMAVWLHQAFVAAF
jgi:hypothetical protein